MTLAWAHAEGKKVILDGVIEKRPPFSPRTCVEEFSEILKRHGITRVVGEAAEKAEDFCSAWPARPCWKPTGNGPSSRRPTLISFKAGWQEITHSIFWTVETAPANGSLVLHSEEPRP
jgi:hypothetical protein